MGRKVTVKAGNCRICGDTLSLNNNWAPSYEKRNNWICTKCNAEKCKRYHADNKDTENARTRDYHWLNRDTIINKSQKYISNHPDRVKWTAYRGDAKRRGLPFDLTKEEFMSFWQLPCSYCGSAIDTIGLDRVDSSAGYSIDNVVPCCTVCNRMKNVYSPIFFIDHCIKIAERTQK
jgi:hypothetical protein